MLEGRIRAAGAKPTEAELQALAKAAYDELLTELCTTQRSNALCAEHHSSINHACADYYDRLARYGCHLPLMREEELQLAEQGWSEQRIADLREIVELRAKYGQTRFRPELIDPQLQAIGYEPTPELRWMAELVLYPAYRNAHLDAEASLQHSLSEQTRSLKPAAAGPTPTSVATTSARQPSPQPDQTPGTPAPEKTIPEEWRLVTPTQAAERLINYRPALWEHRKKGKRAIAQVGEQTLRQIRWASTLLEKSTGGRPLWQLTQEDLKELDRWFDRLPTNFGKSPWHREPETTLEEICLDAEERVASGDLDVDDIGLQVGTTNKHYRKLAQVHEFMCEQIGGAVSNLKFSDFISPDLKTEREGCATYTVEQGKELFSCPPGRVVGLCRSAWSPEKQPFTIPFSSSYFWFGTPGCAARKCASCWSTTCRNCTASGISTYASLRQGVSRTPRLSV